MPLYGPVPLQVGPSPLLLVLIAIFVVIIPASTLWYVWQTHQRINQIEDELEQIEYYLENHNFRAGNE